MTKYTEYVVIERKKFNRAIKELGKNVFTTSELITAGGSFVVATDADAAEQSYITENGGKADELLAWPAWSKQ